MVKLHSSTKFTNFHSHLKDKAVDYKHENRIEKMTQKLPAPIPFENTPRLCYNF
jgi:putative component of toxin-antitoxin plasmid stabilization module